MKRYHHHHHWSTDIVIVSKLQRWRQLFDSVCLWSQVWQFLVLTWFYDRPFIPKCLFCKSVYLVSAATSARNCWKIASSAWNVKPGTKRRGDLINVEACRVVAPFQIAVLTSRLPYSRFFGLYCKCRPKSSEDGPCRLQWLKMGPVTRRNLGYRRRRALPRRTQPLRSTNIPVEVPAQARENSLVPVSRLHHRGVARHRLGPKRCLSAWCKLKSSRPPLQAAFPWNAPRGAIT